MTLQASLSPPELRRYSRHLLLPEVGREGQERLKNASVLIVGAGGLGSPVAMYLAAAGVGRLGLVDFDTVDESNLQRQLLHGVSDVGRSKLDSARHRLHEINPHVVLDLHETRVSADNALDLIEDYEVVADGTDNFATRYLVNDACVLAGVPSAYASISRFDGQASVFCTPDGPCYRCLFPEMPPPELIPNCAEGGVLGVLPGLLGTIQATESLKLLLGIGDPLIGRLLLVETLGMRFREIALTRNPDCPTCGDGAHPTLISSDSSCLTPSMAVPEITVHDLNALREQGNAPFVLDVRRPEEYDIANLNGALIPLDQLPFRVGELDEHRDDTMLVVHCRSGARSAKAVEFLQSRGFTNAVNLKGGVLAWSDEIDPSMPKY